MTDAGVFELAQRALTVAVMISAPVLGFGLLVGLTVSVFQAATQIQEMTLTFVPKIIAIITAVVIFGPWMLASLVRFTSRLLATLPNLVRQMSILDFGITQIVIWLLVFARTAGIFTTAPVFGNSHVPVSTRVAWRRALRLYLRRLPPPAKSCRRPILWAWRSR